MENLKYNIVLLPAALIILVFTFSCSRNLENAKEIVPYTIGEVLLSDDFSGNLSLWSVEGESPKIIDGKLEFDNSGFAAAWLRPSLVGNVMIEYDVTVLSQKEQGGSSFGCFAMAADPGNINKFFAAGRERAGQLSRYDNLNLYYVEFGCDEKNPMQILRYKEGQKKSINQKAKYSYENASDNKYHIKLLFFEGLIECYVNDECLLEYEDSQAYVKGNFGLTVNSGRISMDNVVITHLRLP